MKAWKTEAFEQNCFRKKFALKRTEIEIHLKERLMKFFLT